jgi:hypothetical protein
LPNQEDPGCLRIAQNNLGFMVSDLSYISILNILIAAVHYKEYYLTTKDSITIPFIIQKLVDHPFELLKENKSHGRLPQEKKVYSI